MGGGELARVEGFPAGGGVAVGAVAPAVVGHRARSRLAAGRGARGLGAGSPDASPPLFAFDDVDDEDSAFAGAVLGAWVFTSSETLPGFSFACSSAFCRASSAAGAAGASTTTGLCATTREESWAAPGTMANVEPTTAAVAARGRRTPRGQGGTGPRQHSPGRLRGVASRAASAARVRRGMSPSSSARSVCPLSVLRVNAGTQTDADCARWLSDRYRRTV